MFENITYTIKESKDNIKDSVIEKTGHKITFTFAAVEAHKEKLAKSIKELMGKREIELASMENVKSNHPKFLELTGEEMVAAAIYEKSREMVQEIERAVSVYEKQLAEYEAEETEAKKQLNING
jgi:hypothetical protein